MASKEKDQLEQLAYIINSVDGSEPPNEAKKIIHSYVVGEIDYRTALKLIEKMYSNNKNN